MEKEDGTGPGKNEDQTAEELPTLKRIEFLVLVVLADGENHGYRIVQEISRLTGGRVKVLPGNLYAVLRRLTEDGLLVEASRKPAPELADKRRRHYQITGFGKRVLSAEAELLRSLVHVVSERALIPDGASS